MIVFRMAIWLVVLAILASPVAAWFALDEAPLVERQPQRGIDAVRAARDFLAQYDPRSLPAGRVTEITATAGQINAALAGALSPVPGVNVRVAPSPNGLVAGITGELPVPENPLGRYLNIRMVLDSSEGDIHIIQMSIGDIDVPAPIVRPVFVFVMDRLAGPGSGRAFLETARGIRVDGDRIKVTYGPGSALADRIGEAAGAAAAGQAGR